MNNTLTKTCAACNETKPMECFGMKKVKEKLYPRSHCKPCHNKRQPMTPARIATRQRVTRKRNQKLSALTAALDIDTIAGRIVLDCRKADKKIGQDNDLDRTFVRDMLTKGCNYCGAGYQEIRMTLDRINNDLGHLKSNVLPACKRCNFVRGNMPFEAWEFVKRGMKEARLAGAFGEWTGPKVGAKKLVGMTGLEPATSAPPAPRSTT